eukprot:Plantae.Rhodophyta-Purpureofilum_apyrenoidigerum.ctg15672.p1 GENE.Plantae.Rhodophyta-Purpureofilum_apyrenoidigerum.ctg15672~~Plantae.Rhodophyta-Purpureofilum_apyrenoidigerum.ctg15672.p1  ORF type:complete len:564 (+),score=137.19 Plantae.Rhodophyta-Purpureofilum_apyrenoidigerum.ctg15672:400-2091(+)
MVLPQAAIIDKRTALAVLRTVNLLEESDHFALDIGGSLAKLLYVQRNGDREKGLIIEKLDQNWPGAQLSVPIPEIGAQLHFFAFETRNITDLVKVFREQWINIAPELPNSETVRATGGGAVKYSQLFQDELGVELHHLDEMACLVRGLNFLLTKVQNEVYLFDHEPLMSAAMSAPASDQVFPQSEHCRKFVDARADPFPYLLVNIGSGVSIIRVTGFNEYERVSGSSLGGGTFWGLTRLLTNCKTFDEVIELTNSGDNSKVDMLVGDIYGGDYGKFGLDASVIAASFGKVTMKKELAVKSTINEMWKQLLRAIKGCSYLWLNFLLTVPGLGELLRWMDIDRKAHEQLANLGLRSAFSANDVALSLLRMVAFNIGQIAFLNSKRYDIKRIYFGGNFIRDHPFTLAAISFAVRFWSQGETQALFLQHDGFLGVIGAFLGHNYDARVLSQWDTSELLSAMKDEGKGAIEKKRKKKGKKQSVKSNGTGDSTVQDNSEISRESADGVSYENEKTESSTVEQSIPELVVSKAVKSEKKRTSQQDESKENDEDEGWTTIKPGRKHSGPAR